MEKYSDNPKISIHAPPRGATLSSYQQNRNVGFQFTPLREGRRESQETAANR